jgi:glucokinase
MAEPIGKPGCVLAGDVGGTKTNLGLFVKGKTRPVARVTEKFPSRDANSLEAIIDQMLTRHPAKIQSACFGMAGPVINGVCRTTNLPWVVREDQLRRRFGWKQAVLINDLGATALAIPLLQHREMKSLNRARLRKNQTTGLIAPGTGLGLAVLVPAGDQYRPVPSEGGHANFAPSESDEIGLWRYLQSRFGHVSRERVLSGQGLVNIYNWLKSSGRFSEAAEVAAEMESSDGARVIAENAIRVSDPLCRAALEKFCRIFGSISGDLALTGMTTGGVFLGGGIAPKILPALVKGPFLSGFLQKGRFEAMMKNIAVKVILNESAALLGAASLALNRQP